MEKGILQSYSPKLRRPVLVVGFEGWGNALSVSSAMASYLIRSSKAVPFATLNSDLFYRYDDIRPTVHIENGKLESVTPPGGTFYVSEHGMYPFDIVVLRAVEPTILWGRFVEELFRLCDELGVRMLLSIGGMYDNVLHSDRIVSGIASTETLLELLVKHQVLAVTYRGPSSIHSTIHAEGKKRGLDCISLWGHCPYYLEGATHFGLVSHIATLLGSLLDIEFDTEELEGSWKQLNRQIQDLVEGNPELSGMINELRKAKVKGSWEFMKQSGIQDQKIIHLKDFLGPR